MEELTELYYNPKMGLVSPYKLYIKLKKRIPLKTIEEFVKKQESYQRKIQRNYPKQFKPIVVYSRNEIDLFDFSRYSHWNAGYKHLLCCVDVFSRKAFVSAIKRKSDTTEAMSKILAKDKPILIQSDNGTEFLNNSFQRLLKSMNVRHTTVDVGDKKRQGIVERFNRTIALMISRYQESRNTNRYIDVLEDIVYNYNHTFHRAIKDTPENRFVTNPSSGTFKVYTPRDTLRIGDSVRILNNKTAFCKGYEPTFDKTIYQIYKGDGYSFSLRDEFGVPLDRRYKLYELQKITAMEKYHHPNPVRETPLTQQQRRNKRELEDLLEHTVEPLHKKRKTFTGN